MRSIYRIDRVTQNLKFCLVQGHGTVSTYDLSRGNPFLRAPEDFREAKLAIDDEEGGFGQELTDLLGCTNTLLLLRNTVFDTLEKELELGPVESHRFRVMHGEAVHSDDYVIVNPLENRACFSHEHADFMVTRDQSRILRVREFVLVDEKLPKRDLFRVAEKPQAYFVTQAFVDVVRARRFTNFTFKKVRVV